MNPPAWNFPVSANEVIHLMGPLYPTPKGGAVILHDETLASLFP